MMERIYNARQEIARLLSLLFQTFVELNQLTILQMLAQLGKIKYLL